MRAVDLPFLSVGDMFQHEEKLNGQFVRSGVFLVIKVVPRNFASEKNIEGVIFEFICINSKTLKQAHEFQFSYDNGKLPSYYRILSR